MPDLTPCQQLYIIGEVDNPENTKQMDKVARWAERRSEKEAGCNWCSVTFKYNNLGVWAFKNHSKSKGHKMYSDERYDITKL